MASLINALVISKLFHEGIRFFAFYYKARINKSVNQGAVNVLTLDKPFKSAHDGFFLGNVLMIQCNIVFCVLNKTKPPIDSFFTADCRENNVCSPLNNPTLLMLLMAILPLLI